MLKNDRWIVEQARAGMIDPFEAELVRQVVVTDAGQAPQADTARQVLSYGLSSYGYDIRLSPADFRIFRHIPGTVVDPKRFNQANLEPTHLHVDECGEFFILPAHSYGLGVAIERLDVPPTITIISIGKSTYARCGIIANLTPAEACWRGHLTLEFSNASSADCRIYANEGVVQLLFLEGEPCSTTYADRAGKYQDQPQQVIAAKV